MVFDTVKNNLFSYESGTGLRVILIRCSVQFHLKPDQAGRGKVGWEGVHCNNKLHKNSGIEHLGSAFRCYKKQSRGSLDASRHGPGHTVARAAAWRDPRALNTTTRTLLCGSCHPPHHLGPLRTCQPTFGTSDRSWTNSQSSDHLHRFLFKQNISFSNNKL